jgi:hypothetical protein
LDDSDAVKNKEERTLYYTVKENDKLDVKVGLQDQDKTFVFKDVDTTDVKKVDVSLKDDKVNLDVTKKDGSTTALTPSEDSAKTEDKKKEEEKKEEKKEETAKADSSNKSNSSESKKNNTASTSSSSNKNNSSSSSSKPAEHTHNWVAQYKTVNVPEKGHNEQVLVQAAYDEQVPITKMKAHDICNVCGADITNDASDHTKAHTLAYEGGGWHTEWKEEVTGYQTVHHEAVYETKYVVDSPATTKQELAGYKCSGCGKTKAN